MSNPPSALRTIAFAAALAAPALAADPAPAESPAATPVPAPTPAPAGDGENARVVLAHYMVCFTPSASSVRREIALARQYGIQGWALNCGNWQRRDEATGEWVDHERYRPSTDLIFETALRFGEGFRLAMSPDNSKEHFIWGNHIDAAERFADHPNLLRYRGRRVISGWNGGFDKYQYMREELVKRGLDYLIIPSFGPTRHVMAAPADLCAADMFLRPDWACDGAFRFACDGTTRELVQNNANYRFAALKTGNLYMAGACPHYNSSNLRDYHGIEGWAAQWRGIVNDQPEMVELVTWNDYNEDTHIMPSQADWHPKHLPARLVHDRDESFLDATAYFSAAYRAHGRYPEVTQDKLYLCHRARPKRMTRAYRPDDPASGPDGWSDERDYFLQIHDDVQDRVYAAAFLVADAEIEIAQGGDARRKILHAPLDFFDVPMVPGATVRARLLRGGETIAETIGPRQIVAEETERNSLAFNWKSVVQRFWTAGAVAGAPSLVLRPADAALSGFAPETAGAEDGGADAAAGADGRDGAAASGQQDAPAIRFASPGAAAKWTLPQDFAPGPSAIRVRYRNRSPEEARLTLLVDVEWLDETEDRACPARIPVYLPSTGDAEGVRSMLFTIPEGARAIVLSRDTAEIRVYDAESRLVPSKADYSDYGEPEIIAVEIAENQILDRVPPPPTDGLPEMVFVSGGTFTMGARAQDDDEGPAREVELSPFAIGRFEVTNEEFERFMPEHASHRTSFSWRDREPVVFVSWNEAAAYCNWLSANHGLTPAYDPDGNWALVPGADGFRLPTEAEWEYVATGRGENRLYPWGDEAPTPERGNFASDGHAFSQSGIATALQDGGTAVVGSFPAGASRDGVMDMAGNVAEWCSDWYRREPPAERTDPVEIRPWPEARVRFRSIRGGSWGYYGISQRCCDREFNSPVYPGYCYIGFRLALPLAGVTRLNGLPR